MSAVAAGLGRLAILTVWPRAGQRAGPRRSLAHRLLRLSLVQSGLPPNDDFAFNDTGFFRADRGPPRRGGALEANALRRRRRRKQRVRAAALPREHEAETDDVHADQRGRRGMVIVGTFRPLLMQPIAASIRAIRTECRRPRTYPPVRARCAPPPDRVAARAPGRAHGADTHRRRRHLLRPLRRHRGCRAFAFRRR